MEQIVYLNGSYLPLGKAEISVMDFGFLYGYGLFETMRAYNGKVFRLASHLVRLELTAEKMGIPVGIHPLQTAITETLSRNRLKEARIRITLSSGKGGFTPDPRSSTIPTVLVTATAYTPLAAEVYERGFKAIVTSIRRNSQSPLSGMKTANYLENLLARREIGEADEAIFLNDKGHIAEASASNLFLIIDNTLKTPDLGSGILPGITRGLVLEIAALQKMVACESSLELDELFNADEAFLTNAVMEIMPLTSVNGKKIGSGEPGIITRQIMESYKDMVARETAPGTGRGCDTGEDKQLKY